MFSSIRLVFQWLPSKMACFIQFNSPWVIHSTAFSHETGKYAPSGVSGIVRLRRSYKLEKFQWKKCTNGRLLNPKMYISRTRTAHEFKMVSRWMAFISLQQFVHLKYIFIYFTGKHWILPGILKYPITAVFINQRWCCSPTLSFTYDRDNIEDIYMNFGKTSWIL